MLTQIRNIVEKLNSGQYGNEYEQNTASSVSDSVSKTEFLSLLSRVERLEALVSQYQKSNNGAMTAPASIPKMVRITPPEIVSMDEIDESDAPVIEKVEKTEKKRLVPMKK
jgi:hypothetical protein